MDAKSLSSTFAIARKRPLSFALLAGKSELVLEAHRTKSVEAVRKIARQNGGGAKGAWGTMSLSGSKLTLRCEEEPPGSFAKQARDFFAEHGQKVQVLIEITADEAAPEQAPEEKAPSRRSRSDSKDDTLAPRAASRLADRKTGGAPASDGETATNVDPDERGGAAETDPAAPVDPSEDIEDLASARTEGADGASDGGVKTLPEDTDSGAAEEDAPDESNDDDAATDFEKIIAMGRKAALNFAWLMGKETPVLKAHRRKPVPALIKLGKADGGAQRGAWGTLRVSGKVIELTCEEEPPSLFARAAREQLKAAGLLFKVMVISPAGTGVSSYEDDAGDASVTSAGPDAKGPEDRAPEPADKIDVILSEYGPVFEHAKPLLKSGSPEQVRALRADLASLKKAFVARDATSAGALLDQLKARVGFLGAEPGDGAQSDADGSEAETEEEEIDLRTLLVRSKRRPMNFAWLVGKEGPVLRAHHEKPVEAMVRAARAAGGGASGAQGQLSLSGKLLTLWCEDPPSGGIARSARQSMVSSGLDVRIEVRLPSGAVDAEPHNASPTDAIAPAEPVTEGRDGEAWQARREERRQGRAALKPRVLADDGGGGPGANVQPYVITFDGEPRSDGNN